MGIHAAPAKRPALPSYGYVLSVAIRSGTGTAGSRLARTRGLSGRWIVRRDLAAPGPGTAGIGVLAASRAGAAGLIPSLVIGTARLRSRYRSALVGGGLAAARIGAGARLGSTIHFTIHLVLLRTAAGLAFTIPGGTATSFSIICHQIAPGLPPFSPHRPRPLRGGSVSFVRTRNDGSACDAMKLASRCLCVQYATFGEEGIQCREVRG